MQQQQRGSFNSSNNNPEPIVHTKQFLRQQYTVEKAIAQGSSGIVYLVTDGIKKYAIKRIVDDKKSKSREVEILQMLQHPNIIQLINVLQSSQESNENQVDLVTNFMPENLGRFIASYKKNNSTIPNLLIKLYAYQILRALAYLSGCNIIHRDIKPENILLDQEILLAQVCDFGSAKFHNNEQSTSYICSRSYRAPELILGSSDYDQSVDMWSFGIHRLNIKGCILTEMILLQPLFQGDNNVEQMLQIIRVLGTPSAQQQQDMNDSRQQYQFPYIRKLPLIKFFAGRQADPYLINLISLLLIYSPKERLTPIQALQHPYFDQLRARNFSIQNQQIPALFNFKKQELLHTSESEQDKLIPQWLNEKPKVQLPPQDLEIDEPDMTEFVGLRKLIVHSQNKIQKQQQQEQKYYQQQQESMQSNQNISHYDN